MEVDDIFSVKDTVTLTQTIVDNGLNIEDAAWLLIFGEDRVPSNVGNWVLVVSLEELAVWFLGFEGVHGAIEAEPGNASRHNLKIERK